ncbi:hypothetical protein BJY04DRAFT_223262 [Aspergillus karnatakaensis]|uniref:Zn(II)2Cys6 transcription factor domain-containing protein n=1 Tax=Aspergillus karnatakaensis TaxID=1810916 RepID=UPI003CCCB08A
MKVKQRTTCQTCRKRKLGCDGKTPECSQCTFSGRRCDGYSTDWTFVQDARSKPGKKGKGEAPLTTNQRPKSSDQTLTPSDTKVTISSGDFVALIVNSYMPTSELQHISDSSDTTRSRICGSWVETLPELLHGSSDSSVLYSAAKALALAITSPTSRSSGSVACTQSYSVAIQALRKGFLSPESLNPAELTASVMCLGLAEVMFPDSSLGLEAHFSGIEQLFQANGPQKYSSGVLHKLFVGFRPLLVLQALQNRRSTFLAEDSWMTAPFTVFSPSPMQSLLCKGLPLSKILIDIDVLLTAESASIEEAAFIFTSLLETISRLEEWERSLRSSLNGPPYWSSPPSNHNQYTPSSKLSLWFPNITLANVYTHLWAFHIICLSELENLVDHLPCLILEHTTLWDRFLALGAEKQMPVLAENICSSMDYLLQDEMGLFGPGSTFLPLMMAHRAFVKHRGTETEDVAWVREIVNRLVAKGLRSAPMAVYRIQ